MAVFVKNIADHFGPWVKEHVVPEGVWPIANGKARAFAGDEAADEKQRKSSTGEDDGESMGRQLASLGLCRDRDDKDMMCSNGREPSAGTELLILRQPVLLHFRRAIFIGATVHHGLDLEVSVWRRRCRDRFQSIRLPRISFGLLTGKQAPEEIIEEENLRSAEN